MDNTTIKYSGINHVALVTGNMDKTLRFWRDLLGLELSAGFGKPGYRQYFFKVTEADYITFFEWDGAEPVEEKEHGSPIKGPIGFDHIALGLKDEDDLWQMKARLEAADIWVSEVINHGFIHSIYSFDPNGIPIEFSIFVKGVNIADNPVMTDKEPVKSALEGHKPQADVWPRPEPIPPKAERRVYPGMGSEQFSNGISNKKGPSQ